MVTCTTCGMRADLDPELHEQRYGHWPTVTAEHPNALTPAEADAYELALFAVPEAPADPARWTR